MYERVYSNSQLVKLMIRMRIQLITTSKMSIVFAMSKAEYLSWDVFGFGPNGSHERAKACLRRHES